MARRPAGAAWAGARRRRPGDRQDTLLWELADEIAYQRAPDAYDEVACRDWDPAASREAVDLDGATVIDAGAGTGLVALRRGRASRTGLRRRARGDPARLRARQGQATGPRQVFVLDGTLSAIPLPPASADVLVTCRAIGWDLPAELSEVERVLRPDGVALHLVGRPYPLPADDPLHVALLRAGYTADPYRGGTADLARYRRM